MPERLAYKAFDRYAPYQWNIKLITGQFNVASVWDFAGLQRPVIAALLDDGVDPHEDLPAGRIRSDGRDFSVPQTDSIPNPAPTFFHGMCCAGILAASHCTDSLDGLSQNSGVISLNPHLQILPIKIWPDGDDSEVHDSTKASYLAAGFNWARQHGAEVLSCSWGWPNPSHQNFPILNEAIDLAYLMGRNGKGCPVVFASGNSADAGFSVGYPANLPHAFAVGALQYDNNRYWYSQYGQALDIMAPSGDPFWEGIWSLDQMGSLGVSPDNQFDCDSIGRVDPDYVCWFSGTSAAAPEVAGVATLLLARDSTLTAADVYYILKQSAVRQVGGRTITPPDNEYGWGRVDAFRAMLSITRGDASNDGLIDITDLAAIIDQLFYSAPTFPSPLLGDCDCTGTVDIADLQYMIDILFFSGPAPRKPCFQY